MTLNCYELFKLAGITYDSGWFLNKKFKNIRLIHPLAPKCDEISTAREKHIETNELLILLIYFRQMLQNSSIL